MQWFRNLRIATKLVVSFGLFALVACAVGFVGISNIRSVSDGATALYEEMTVPLAQSGEMNKVFARIRGNVRDVVFAATPEDQAKYHARVQELTLVVDSLSKVIAKEVDSEAMQAKVAQLQEARAAYLTLRDRTIALALAGQTEEARALLYGDAYAAAKTVEAALDDLARIKMEEARQQATGNASVARAAIRTMAFLIAAGYLAAVLLGLALARLIASPVRSLADKSKRMMDGDYSVRFELDTRDEVGLLSRAFQSLMDWIAKAWEEVQAEKAGIEKRVEEAVAASVAEKEYLARNTARMLHEMERFAQGDLTVSLQAERDDEIGRLFQGFNHAVSNIRRAILEVNQAVEATASAATQISSSTEELARGSEEQSSQAHEVAAAVEQMVATAVENARTGAVVEHAVEESRATATEGGAVVVQTAEKMREIEQQTSDVEAAVDRFATSSQKIGEIVEVIDGIADQTNLLALNAAIEAARAGEHGRGFAVVADEVRKLAERTTTATKEVTAIIRQLQDDTAHAVTLTNRSKDGVGQGMRLADEAGVALSRIVGQAERTAMLLGQLGAAGAEQAKSSEQIGRSVDAIATVTQESASGVSQIARAADDLSRLTENLRTLVSAFHLEGAGVEGRAGSRPRAAATYGGDGARGIPVLR